MRTVVFLDEVSGRLVEALAPEAEDVRDAIKGLLGRGEEWAGLLFGWLAHFEPELLVRSEDGARVTVLRPATLTIGSEAAWTMRLTWPLGIDHKPLVEQRSNVDELEALPAPQPQPVPVARA